MSYVVSIDIAGAYDGVWRDGLRYKLRNEFRLRGPIYWWLDSFLRDRYGRCEVNGVFAEYMCFDIGVSQGASVSHILYLCYSNGLTHSADALTGHGEFADDYLL